MAKKSEDKAPANAMDYPEHERTYEHFLKFALWTTAGCVALLIAMAFGFFGGGGLIGGTVLFFILLAISYFFI